MFNHAERGRAATIANGCPVGAESEPMHPKTEAYGRLAGEIFARISLEAVAADMQQFEGDTVRDLAKALQRSLYTQADGARRSVDTTRIDELLHKRREGQYGWDELPFIALERVVSGVKTAVFAEEITLATLKHRTKGRGEIITRAGAHSSQRAPFALAMLSLEGLNPALKATTDYLPLSERPGENGRIFSDDACRLDSRSGLILTGNLKEYAERVESTEPHIGCPVTLLKGFIRGFHCIAADAAIRNDIITPVG